MTDPAGSALTILLSKSLSGSQMSELHSIAPNARILTKEDIARDPPLIGTVDVSYAGMPSDLWPKARRLRWLQTTGAGVEGLCRLPEVRTHPAVITNARIHAEPIASHLWGMCLMLSRNLPLCARAQEERRWAREEAAEGLLTLAGKTLCVAGLGEIGLRCARIGLAFDMRVIGIRRNPRPVGGVDEVFGPERKRDAMALADVIMAVLPATAETRLFFSAPEFDVMRGTLFLNAGRGACVDTEALMDALRSGKVRGAGLDVVDPEPLPPEHPLWGMPNTIITPHCAGAHAEYPDHAARVFLDNLRRFIGGLPLRFRVDKEAGY